MRKYIKVWYNVSVDVADLPPETTHNIYSDIRAHLASLYWLNDQPKELIKKLSYEVSLSEDEGPN